MDFDSIDAPVSRSISPRARVLVLRLGRIRHLRLQWVLHDPTHGCQPGRHGHQTSGAAAPPRSVGDLSFSVSQLASSGGTRFSRACAADRGFIRFIFPSRVEVNRGGRRRGDAASRSMRPLPAICGPPRPRAQHASAARWLMRTPSRWASPCRAGRSCRPPAPRVG